MAKPPELPLFRRATPAWGQRRQLRLDTLASILVAAVNVRFLRFKHPVWLAVAAGLVTVALTAVVASILWTQSCRYYRLTAALPFISQQLGPDAACEPAGNGNEGWLLSDTVAYSDGVFSKEADAFYHKANLSEQWQRWPLLVNATFDMAELYRVAGNAAADEFGEYSANCTSQTRRSSLTFQELQAGCTDGGCAEWRDTTLAYENPNPSSIYSCFRDPPATLPNVGDVAIELASEGPRAVQVRARQQRRPPPAGP
jgi:hypothetical protein